MSTPGSRRNFGRPATGLSRWFGEQDVVNARHRWLPSRKQPTTKNQAKNKPLKDQKAVSAGENLSRLHDAGGVEKKNSRADAGAKRGRRGLSQKIQKSSKSVLTLGRAPDYIRLINEGGAPLATKKFASETALDEIKREPRKRHSTGSGAKGKRTHDTAFAMSVL